MKQRSLFSLVEATPYRWKRLLSYLICNWQSLRWQTQGLILARAAREKRLLTRRALDLGCGGGTYAIENHLRFSTPAVLCDFDGAVLLQAQEQVRESGYSNLASFVQAGAE